MSGLIRAILFDAGSVLFGMGDLSIRQRLAERIGVPLARIDDLVFGSPSAQQATVGELTVDQHWQQVMAALGLPLEMLPDFMAQFWSADVLNIQLADLIRSLRGRYKIGLLSNAWSNMRQVLDERFHVADLFDELIISAEVGLAKPDPRIYRLAVQRLDVQPSETVFIDDVLKNVEAARLEGLHAIQYLDFEQMLAELNPLLEMP
ncbi:MAG TPA: HAD family phosphatase [Anaerolineales bacterium]|nr:HAD family phosphatase [Anaerolineales bacterium]